MCQCTHYHDVFAKGSEEPVYQIVVGKACCGAHNNCCGATCFKESMIFDVLDKDGKRVATIEKIFAREEEGCLGGVCRALHDFSNYVVSFPPGASLEEKQLLLGALTQVEYLYFVPEVGRNRFFFCFFSHRIAAVPSSSDPSFPHSRILSHFLALSCSRLVTDRLWLRRLMTVPRRASRPVGPGRRQRRRRRRRRRRLGSRSRDTHRWNHHADDGKLFRSLPTPQPP